MLPLLPRVVSGPASHYLQSLTICLPQKRRISRSRALFPFARTPFASDSASHTPVKAVLLLAYGGTDQLQYSSSVPRPEPADDEVLVRVKATSLNPIDWKMRSGAAKNKFPVTFPAILGRDIAGDVVQVGTRVNSLESGGFTQGQRVMALATRTYAEYAVVKADALAPIPDALDYEHAAALPLVTLTGSQLIERAAKVQRGQTILVTGALGSVGRTAVYVAQQHGAIVIAGVRASQRKQAEQFAKQVIALDDGRALELLKDLDIVADTIGGTIGQRLLHSIKPGGTYASVVGPPRDAEKFDIRVALMTAQPDASRLAELALDEADGEFNIPIEKMMPLSQVREAHELGEKGGLTGKIILVP
jgi:NADPH:quinone reductase-like Zn-dependent oxidoreductase